MNIAYKYIFLFLSFMWLSWIFLKGYAKSCFFFLVADILFQQQKKRWRELSIVFLGHITKVENSFFSFLKKWWRLWKKSLLKNNYWDRLIVIWDDDDNLLLCNFLCFFEVVCIQPREIKFEYIFLCLLPGQKNMREATLITTPHQQESTTQV